MMQPRYLLLCCCVLGGMWALPTTERASADEDQQLEQYLERLGLVELQIVQMTGRLDTLTDKRAQEVLARRIADLLAAQLMDHADQPAKYQSLLRRVQQLLSEYPSAKTTSLEVMLLQADYNRAESLAGQWLDDASEESARQEAETILAKISPQLASQLNGLEKQIADANDALDALQPGKEMDAKLRELQRLDAIAARARYFAAWANYYGGLVGRDDPTSARFNQAEQLFRAFTGATEGNFKSGDAELLGLDNVWRARAMIGLGITLAARGKLADSRVAFDLLDDGIVPPHIQAQAPYWHVRGLLTAGHCEGAIDFARKQIAAFAGKPTKGRLSMCVELVRGAFRDGVSGANQSALVDVGLLGLSRLGQPQLIDQLLQTYDIPLDASAGFVVQAAKGKQLFDAAEKSGKAEDYQAAKTVLAAAVTAKGSDQDVKAGAYARYRLAWCCFRLKEFEQAGQHFEQAGRSLLAISDPAAVDSTWMAFASFQQISKQDARHATTAVRLLESVKRDHPQHPYAAKADYYISRLMENASPESAARSLAKVAPGDPNYLNARFDLCLLLHRAWSQAGNDKQRQAAADEVQRAAETYLKAATNDQDDARKVRVCMQAVEVLAEASPTAAAAYLDQAKGFAARLPSRNAAVAEYHYRAMRFAAAQGDPKSQQQHATWIATNAAQSPYALPALVVAARGIDAQCSQQPADEQLVQKAHSIYAALSEKLGTTSDVMRQQKNARIAASKRAEYAAKLGRQAEAAQLLEALVSAFPDDKGYLRRAATIQFERENLAAALPHWRILVKGSPRNSSEWYEAKYHQIACLAVTDPPLAKQVMGQFRMLHPELGPPELRPRFQALAARL